MWLTIITRIIGAVLVLLTDIVPILASNACTGMPELGPLASRPTVLYLPSEAIASMCNLPRGFGGCAFPQHNRVYLTDKRELREQGWTTDDISCLHAHEQAHLWHENNKRWDHTHTQVLTR